ncbi:endoribonuclease L-PSP, putative [Sphaerochaeta pleomorpha str. Grapes]|uniref:Endoribonuclease L-PSP, putative n=1 Tax=Sphaerochaeta pleomorpha (strain ATCC BAA-1885 / DSM 22778 / Grapes) TaxID=158190 RepID=G8QYY3_SPHPG|nr:Rid family detoxifying hydrolase [Sphaerochaeta pleomorpha]AEV30842.1 endoribonuclease L-PSP, putative [Sphaerochaeta pleomorpha str. Grapes]
MKKEIIQTDKAPKAIGPYSQATVYNDVVYTSAQLPIDPVTNELLDGDIAQQTDLAMKNLAAVLSAAGSSFDKVLKCTVFITDMSQFSKVNAVYARYYEGIEPPARACVEVTKLAKGAMVEIEVIATR